MRTGKTLKTATESLKEKLRMQIRQSGDSCAACVACYSIDLLTNRG
jgi:hypothetical protein